MNRPARFAPPLLWRLFRRRPEIREMITGAEEIQENLDWCLRRRVRIVLRREGTGEERDVVLAAVDHSPERAFLLFREEAGRPGLPAWKRRDLLAAEYASPRGVRYRFQCQPLAAPAAGAHQLKAAYPALIERVLQADSVRIQDPAADPIPVSAGRDQGVVVDIGPRGIKFASNRLFEAGTLLEEVRVDLPQVGPVRGAAVVKHIQPSRALPMWRYLCGAEFTAMGPRDQRRLSRFVARRLARRGAGAGRGSGT